MLTPLLTPLHQRYKTTTSVEIINNEEVSFPNITFCNANLYPAGKLMALAPHYFSDATQSQLASEVARVRRRRQRTEADSDDGRGAPASVPPAPAPLPPRARRVQADTDAIAAAAQCVVEMTPECIPVSECSS